MAKPTLLVIAGCNGSGKSSFSKLLADNKFVPFDYDRYYLQYYRSLLDIDIKEEMAHNMAFVELERQTNEAISEKKDFCYETNFNSTPLFWPDKFKANGYELRMIYLCLDSIEEAKRRVAIRVQNGGHSVPDSEIEKRYFEGFHNLNEHFKRFDSIDIFDTSAFAKEPAYLMSIENGTLIFPNKSAFRPFLKKLLPDIVKLPTL